MIDVLITKPKNIVEKILSSKENLSVTYWAMSAVIAVGLFVAMTLYFMKGGSSSDSSDLLSTEIVRHSETFPNGEIAYEYFTLNGVKEGNETFYKPKGGIEWRCEYKNGKKDGKETVYYRNKDVVHYEIEFKNDLKDGVELLYHDDGIIQSRANYKEGKLDGEYLQYDVRGKAMLQVIYEKDERVGNPMSIR
ncbi:MAG: hypothetical protein FNT15_02615 [Sulfurovum sp.]|nr:MAG: hypothetical protein FNT15_02615 [Sulfurovum sp.]